MTLTDTAMLVQESHVAGPNGYADITETGTEALVEVKSVRRTELYEARKAGTQLAIAFEMWRADYGGQTLIDYAGTRYRVERAYTEGDVVELNCSEVVR